MTTPPTHVLRRLIVVIEEEVFRDLFVVRLLKGKAIKDNLPIL